MEVPRPGVELELQPPAYTTAQQHQIWATSVTHAADCSNARSLIQWARTGIQPLSSQRQCLVFFFVCLEGGIMFCFLSHLRHMEVPGLGVKSELQLRSLPQPHWIRATHETYATACNIIGSLTHWASPGIEPASSQYYVRSLTTEPQWELLCKCFLEF